MLFISLLLLTLYFCSNADMILKYIWWIYWFASFAYNFKSTQKYDHILITQGATTASPTSAVNYLIGPKKLSFDDAEAYCIEQGSHLATIKNDYEGDRAKAKCQEYDDYGSGIGGNGCWIGLYQPDSESSWKWIDGSDLGEYGFYSNGTATTGIHPWYSGEPNSNGGVCIHIFYKQEFNWNDCICDRLNRPICNPLPPTPGICNWYNHKIYLYINK